MHTLHRHICKLFRVTFSHSKIFVHDFDQELAVLGQTLRCWELEAVGTLFLMFTARVPPQPHTQQSYSQKINNRGSISVYHKYGLTTDREGPPAGEQVSSAEEEMRRGGQEAAKGGGQHAQGQPAGPVALAGQEGDVYGQHQLHHVVPRRHQACGARGHW